MFVRLFFLCVLLLSGPLKAQSLLDISQKDWVPMARELRAPFIAATGIEKGLGLIPSLLTIQETGLTWSPGTRLVRVLGGWEPKALVLYFLRLEDGALIHLDGSHAAIAALNERVAPVIDEATVGDYVWFSGFFVRSERGPFLIVESAEDRFIPRLDRGRGKLAAGYDAAADIPRELVCEGVAGAFRCAGTVYHANALFDADFQVDGAGVVDIPSSRPLAVQLAHRVNAPIDPRRLEVFTPLR